MVNASNQQYKYEYGKKVGLICGEDVVNGTIANSIGRISENAFTLLVVNTSDRNASDDSTCSHRYIITITSQPNGPSKAKLSTRFPVNFTSTKNDKHNASSPLPSQLTLCPTSVPTSRILASQPASTHHHAHTNMTNVMYISLLATCSLLALLCVASCLCHYKLIKSRRNRYWTGPQETELARSLPTTRTTGGDMNETLAIELSSFARNPPGRETNNYALEEEMSQERVTGYRQDESKPDVRQSDDPHLGAVGGENRLSDNVYCSVDDVKAQTKENSNIDIDYPNCFQEMHQSTGHPLFDHCASQDTVKREPQMTGNDELEGLYAMSNKHKRLPNESNTVIDYSFSSAPVNSTQNSKNLVYENTTNSSLFTQ